MIKTEVVAPGVLKIIAPHTLKPDDLAGLAPEVDAFMASHGAIDLLVDASHLEGWDSLAALDKHVAFLKARQSKVEHVAVITRHEWQQWLIGAVRPFLHPQIALFEPGHEEAALRWITRHRQAGEGETVSSAGGEPFEGLVADIADGR